MVNRNSRPKGISFNLNNIFVKDVLGTVDFVDKTDGTIVFRTCALEKDRVILQIGTASPERALGVAKLVRDISFSM